MKKLSVILIFAGLLLICIPIVGQISVYYQQKNLMERWIREIPGEDSSSTGDAASEKSKGSSSDRSKTIPKNSKTRPEGDTAAKNAEAETKVIGIMKIDKIGLEAPIINGIGKKELSVGVGFIPGTACIGSSGNTAIAGHRSHTFGKFFNRLDALAIGDEIKIKTKEKTYKYLISGKLIVKPEDTWVLKQNKKEKKLTLITCHPIYVASHRLIVQAKMVE